MLTTEIRENYVFETYASITVTVSGNNGNDLILTDTRILDVIIGNKDVEISPKGFYFTNSINTIQTIPTALSHELISAR
jgi:hypothetical protein